METLYADALAPMQRLNGYVGDKVEVDGDGPWLAYGGFTASRMKKACGLSLWGLRWKPRTKQASLPRMSLR